MAEMCSAEEFGYKAVYASSIALFEHGLYTATFQHRLDESKVDENDYAV